VLVPDINVLVYAYREDSADHDGYLAWLEGVAGSQAPFGLVDPVLSGFLRIVTHPRVFDPPSPIHHALRFIEELRARPNATRIAPGVRHWSIFTGLCRDAGVKGNLVATAYLAALAIESGSDWITTDRDFARFPGLRWHHPLDA
jgi:toxin-antitoxin system PIN domain toxin